MQLRDYQENAVDDGLDVLNKFNILILSMAVRTGKTLTSFSIIEKTKYKKCLFITKKKAISSIQEDYEENNFNFSCKVINYEQIHKEKSHDYDILIIDESHSLNQFPKMSNRTKLIKLFAYNKPIIYLSGTISPESFSGLFHQVGVSSFSPWNEYKNFYQWSRDYVKITDKYIGQRTVKDYSNGIEKIIMKDLDHLIISVSQTQAGFKQEILEFFHRIEMKPITTDLIDKLLKDRIIEGKEDNVTADSPVKLQSKTIQLAGGTIITDSDKYVIIDNSKALYIKEKFEDQKIGIYYIFKSEHDILVETFGADNITYSPEEFNEKDDKIFISQVRSGREGVNLKTADCLIMYGCDFSAVSYFQALNRHQYKDREKQAIVHWIFSNTGLEDKIYKCVKSKKNFTSVHFKDAIKSYKSEKNNQPTLF